MIKKMYISLYVKYQLFLSDFIKTWISLADFRKMLIKFHANPYSGSFTCGRTIFCGPCVCVCVKLILSRISIEHHTVKAYNWSGHSDILCILKHGNRRRWVVSCAPRPHYPRDPQCPFLRGLGESQLVWTIWKQGSVCVCHYLQLLKLFEQATVFSSFSVRWFFVYYRVISFFVNTVTC
jgi:hypothetical protein